MSRSKWIASIIYFFLYSFLIFEQKEEITGKPSRSLSRLMQDPSPNLETVAHIFGGRHPIAVCSGSSIASEKRSNLSQPAT
jgi:hypothetical protein